MDFEDSVAYISYKFYNSFAIHNVPLKILDSFVPLLCIMSHKAKVNLWIKIWLKNKKVKAEND